ncbi:HGL262Wp [Eremothecium sinecaudum]|uniref:Endoplasmic reticulum-Golgi intermediate compartment protein n=1 Tax=Eremothecium sinecaudum TaxID=45286 RepID=A0A109UZZ1_9SACH|nr:HGL262Wp [Eremothecium sinecaudum]AMD22078.1 HGL262Wp [Eremothecium sinecaudum]
MESLKVFDAFPKTDPHHVKRSSKGGVMSMLVYAVLLFIAWVEFGSYFGGYIDEQYIVDKTLRTTAQININMFVKTPCKYLHVTVVDVANDIHVVAETLNLQPIPFYIPYGTRIKNFNDVTTPDLDGILAEAVPAEFRKGVDNTWADGLQFDGCQIYGSIPVNKVKGELRITPKESVFRGIGARKDEINFTHVINEFSFGDFYPYIENSLDGVGRIAQNGLTSYFYFASVVPTLYRKMGAEVDTNQYSVSETDKSVTEKQSHILGIYIRYNFEALTILVKDQRIGFWQFVIRLISILSFVVYMATYAFRFIDWLLVLALGPKWSLRYQSNSQQGKGLLDQPEADAPM